ncbi:MAG: DUF2851 family protein, partial [Dehalococcoidia bacterium]
MTAPEAAIQERWALRPPRSLRTLERERLRVLFAGVWNRGPGPDFRGAILLRDDGRILRGDVELHRRPRDWLRHGHAGDQAYSAVILHLVAALDATAAGQARSPDGRGPPRLALLAASPPPAGSWPCSRVVQQAGAAATAARLQRVACARLRRKARRAAMLLSAASAEQAAYRLLLEALGQGGNVRPMAALAQRLPLAALPFAEGAAAVAARLQAAAREGTWRSSGLRPANAPVRRLRAAAELIARLRAQGDIAVGLAALAALPQAAALQQLRLPGLLGPDRARQLLVDVAYPLALALGGDGDALRRRWLALGGARYGRTAPLRRRLAAGGLRSWRNGATQALLELEAVYCRQGACCICP